ncbi:DNA-3-methyladenine glycosylase family protein [Candidatus Zixiibacteriota bacterium]
MESPLDFGEAVDVLSKADPLLGKMIDRVGPITLPLKRFQSPFRYLTEAITHQQLNGKAAATIFGRFTALFEGKRFPTPEDVLATSDEALRSAGLSRSKSAAIRDLAEKVLDGSVPSATRLKRMSDDEIIKRLTEVRGIGPWTAQMLLIFALGRPDVLPVTDYGVQSGFRIVYGLEEHPTPNMIMEQGELWRPWRTVASLSLWRAVDSLQK